MAHANRLARTTLSVVVAGAVGCTVNLEMEPGVRVSCNSSADCIDGEECNSRAGESGFCVPAGSDQSPPGIVEGSVALALQAPSGCPLDTVTALSRGGSAYLSFSTTRPPSEPPTIRATNGSSTLSAALSSSQGNEFGYAINVSETASAGTYAIIAEIQEERDAAAVAVETDPPLIVLPAPAVLESSVLEALSYHRITAGTEATGGAPSFLIEAASGALPPSTSLWLTAPSGAVVASARTTADGALTVTIPAETASPAVLVTFADEACTHMIVNGHGSPPHLIERIVWTTSLHALKTESPQLATFSGSARLEPFLQQGDRVFWSADLDAADGGVVAQSGAGVWDRVAPRDPPPVIAVHSMAYDDVRGRLVRFGGMARFGGAMVISDATWVFDTAGWREVVLNERPVPRTGAQMVYDAARDEVLLFGGAAHRTEPCLAGYPPVDGQCPLADTWAFDGFQWHQRFPPVSPTPRFFFAMTYDSARARVVVFGGKTTRLSGSPCPPAGVDRGPDACSLGDTWEWDGEQWERKLPVSFPWPREGQAAAYHPESGMTVVFGGATYRPAGTPCHDDAAIGEGACYYGTTWGWDGSQWDRLDFPGALPPTPRPDPRMGAAMAYDRERGELVLFGGSFFNDSPCDFNGFENYCGDVWTWDGETWSSHVPGAGPTPRSTPAMAYDPQREGVLLHAGIDFTTEVTCASGHAPDVDGLCNTQDLWLWDGSTWELLSPLAVPSARTRPNVVWDEGRQRVVLYGGTVSANAGGGCPVGAVPASIGHCAVGDLWEWDGAAWTLATPSTAPPTRGSAAFAHDAARGVAVMYGGFSCDPSLLPGCTAESAIDSDGSCCHFYDTWEWDGTDWLPVATTTRPAGTVTALTYDSNRGRVLAVGGRDETGVGVVGTWEWDGADWLLVADDPHPSGRRDHSLACGADPEQTILFGGDVGSMVASAETWSFDGTLWSQVTSPPDMSSRVNAPMAADPSRGRIILTGGRSIGVRDDTWEWTGSRWLRANIATNYGARLQPGLVYDGTQQRMLLFGGLDGVGDLDDTWTYDAGGESHPAQLASFLFDPDATWTDSILEAVEARWVAGGLGHPSDVATPGARLMLWDGGQWLEIASGSAAPSLPEALVWSSRTDPEWDTLDIETRQARLRRLFIGAESAIWLAASAVAPNGSLGPNGDAIQYGEVVTDYVELTVRYRLVP